ncbi:MAG: aminotransferase class I/II-fold pyridoxal phosphate-dependent enzyme [Ruminococcaceae bacterium]|nr:aminotransferase class I/II-fold pyridoxal phosphate-dependent enzyme [Oscillospiraceae bacterium]
MMDYSKILSSKVTSIKPSGIRKFFDILDEMDDVISLTVGQPDFDTPWHIREAGIYSLEDGRTYYTSNSGLLEFRREVCNYLERRFGLSYIPETEVLCTVGGSEAIDLAMRAILEPGDEVIVVEPSFVCYGPLASLAGGVPVVVNTELKDKFKLTPEKLLAAITDKTKMLVLPYPSNPTGGIMTKDELEKIADIVRDRNIIVLSDEIYAELTYGKKHVSFASLPGMRERTILVSGLSKAYAMTGWRLGYACAPAEIMKQMVKLHQYAIMCAPTTSQYAGIEALRNGDDDIEFMKDSYDQRRRLIHSELKRMGLDSFEPEGAFYIFPNIGKFGMTSEEFCEKLLYSKHVAIVPGTAFGESGEGFARISYAYSVDHIKKALERIEEFINTLK